MQESALRLHQADHDASKPRRRASAQRQDRKWGKGEPPQTAAHTGCPYCAFGHPGKNRREETTMGPKPQIMPQRWPKEGAQAKEAGPQGMEQIREY